VEPGAQARRLDALFIAKDVAATTDRRVTVALGKAALDGFALECRSPRSRQRPRRRQRQQAIDRLERRRIAIRLHVEIGEHLELGHRGVARLGNRLR